MKKIAIALTILILLVYACTHDAIKPSSLTTTPTGNTGTTGSTGSGSGSGTGTSSGGGTTNNTVCFQTDVLPLYQTYCASVGCHDAATAKEGLVLTNYANIIKGISANNTSNSRYYSIIKNGSMPPRNSPKLSSTQIATIATWINQGATNNTCTTPTCDATKTTYSNGISQLFATYCNGCHGVAPGSGGVVLSDYASAKTAGTTMKATFLSAINYTSANAAMNMPQAGKLSDCQISQITTWINNGCPQ